MKRGRAVHLPSRTHSHPCGSGPRARRPPAEFSARLAFAVPNVRRLLCRPLHAFGCARWWVVIFIVFRSTQLKVGPVQWLCQALRASQAQAKACKVCVYKYTHTYIYIYIYASYICMHSEYRTGDSCRDHVLPCHAVPLVLARCWPDHA